MMRLPLELIIVFVLAQAFESNFTPVGGKLPPLTAGAALTALAGLAVMCLVLYLVGLGGARWSIARLRARPGERSRIFEAHGRIVAAEQAVAVLAYAALCALTRWPALVVSPLGRENGPSAAVSVIGDDLLKILPFLLGSLSLWMANYPASRALAPAEWNLGEYIRSQARGLFMLLGPWLVLVGLSDSLVYWPESVARLYQRSASLQIGVSLGVMAGLLTFFPFYLIRLWPHRTLPAGSLRERLEALLVRAGVRCRDLAVWLTGRGRMSNAAVMGPVAWSRYIVFTDALLEDLDEDEVEAVLAHELGHVRYHHIAFYLVFAAAFFPLGLLLFVLLPAPVRTQDWTVAILTVLLIVFYWRVVFGFLSRRFERQADVASCELVGSPLPLMTALEKLARASGTSRTARNWRHYSVAERVAYLSRFGFDRAALEEHHRRVRDLKWLAVVLFAGLAALVPGNWEVLSAHGNEARERSLLEAVEANPHDYDIRVQLGDVQMRLGKFDEAWKTFERVIHDSPYRPDGYRGQAMVCMEENSGYNMPARAVELAREAVRYSREKAREFRGRERLVFDLRLLATAAGGAENYDLAAEAITEACQLAPEDKELAAQREAILKAASRAKEEPQPQPQPSGRSSESETATD
jgi:Zn-dependent protease with chaperone function